MKIMKIIYKLKKKTKEKVNMNNYQNDFEKRRK